MAKQADKLNSLFDAILDDRDKFTDEETQAMRAEALGEESPPGAPPAKAELEGKPDPVKEEPAKVEAEPVVEVTPEADPEAVVDKPLKKLSPAQERIQELVRERNDYESQLNAEKEKWARLDERAKLVREQGDREQAAVAAAQEAQRRANERPDPSLDPMGAELYDAKDAHRKLQQEVATLRDQVGQAVGHTRAQQEVAAFSNALQHDLVTFRNKTPDYDEAARYATEARAKLWTDVGKTKQEADQLVQAESLAIAQHALTSGKSPAAIYYGIATQWGYKPKGSEATIAKVAAVTPKEKLAQVAKGQEVIGFGKSPNVADAEGFDIATASAMDIAAMNEDTFLSLLQDPKSAKLMQKRISELELA